MPSSNTTAEWLFQTALFSAPCLWPISGPLKFFATWGLNASAGRDAGKGPYISKAARNADFAAQPNVQLTAAWQQWAEYNEANRHAAICHEIETVPSLGHKRALWN